MKRHFHYFLFLFPINLCMVQSKPVLKLALAGILKMSGGSVIVRHAKREDCEEILDLKRELADHQNMSNRNMLAFTEWQRDGFDSNPPYFRCLVAETKDEKGKIVGYALYFYAYAAFEGKSLHLEDLCVSKSARGGGVGSKLIKTLANICLHEQLARMTLEVLDWNISAVKFYEKHFGYNSTKADGWVAYSFEHDVMCDLSNSDCDTEMVEKFLIRHAEKKDCQAVADLIKELADYEKMGDKAKLDAAALERDGFDADPPYFRCLVVELKNPEGDERSVIGYALYYYTYSTWLGKGLHLEDFYVTPAYRYQGIGTRVLKKIAKIGVEGDFCRITLECLDWNEPTRKLYEKLNAVNYTETQGWQTYRFVREVMEKLAADDQ